MLCPDPTLLPRHPAILPVPRFIPRLTPPTAPAPAYLARLGREGELHLNAFSHLAEITAEPDGPVLRANGTTAGFLLFGPYIPLPAGRYRATLLLRLDAQPPIETHLAIDIAVDSRPLPGTEIMLGTASLTPNEPTPITLDFTLDADAAHVEVRLQLIQPASVSVIAAVAVRGG